MVPLAILCSLKVRAKNPHRVGIAELFTAADRARILRGALPSAIVAAIDYRPGERTAIVGESPAARPVAPLLVISRLNGTTGWGRSSGDGGPTRRWPRSATVGHPYRVRYATRSASCRARAIAPTASLRFAVWDTALAALALQKWPTTHDALR
jgi:hypothetical protein